VVNVNLLSTTLLAQIVDRTIGNPSISSSLVDINNSGSRKLLIYIVSFSFYLSPSSTVVAATADSLCARRRDSLCCSPTQWRSALLQLLAQRPQLHLRGDPSAASSSHVASNLLHLLTAGRKPPAACHCTTSRRATRNRRPPSAAASSRWLRHPCATCSTARQAPLLSFFDACGTTAAAIVPVAPCRRPHCARPQHLGHLLRPPLH
jgi:hypothetical protein